MNSKTTYEEFKEKLFSYNKHLNKNLTDAIDLFDRSQCEEALHDIRLLTIILKSKVKEFIEEKETLIGLKPIYHIL